MDKMRAAGKDTVGKMQQGIHDKVCGVTGEMLGNFCGVFRNEMLMRTVNKTKNC